MTCPNKFPTQHSNLRIAVIGEAPGKDEEQFGQPFCGASGRFLAALLSRAGVSKEACYLGNVSQYRPINNDISTLNWSGDEIQDGLYQLGLDMKEFKPNIVILLGNVALKAAKDATTIHPLKPNVFQYKNAKWRGSLFLGNSGGPFDGLKCIATYHPAYCLRDSGATPFFQLDLRKAVREATNPLLNLPQRTIDIHLPEHVFIQKCREIREKKLKISPDIEGYVDAMSCVGIAISPQYAFVVETNKMTALMWQELALVMSDPTVEKIYMNGLYDTFVKSFCYGMEVVGFKHDIMISHWHLYSELAKDDKTMSDSESAITNKRTRGKGGMSLAIQASLYTDEPYWKFESKADDHDVQLRYCGKDCCVTYECHNIQMAAFEGKNGWDKVRTATELDLIKKHYIFNMEMLAVIRYMTRRGMRYNIQESSNRYFLLREKLHVAQAELNGMTGYGFSWKNGIKEIRQKAFEIMWTKKGDRPRKEHIQNVKTFDRLIKGQEPSLSTIGEIEDLCEVSLNIGSAPQFQNYLYNILKIPVQMSDVRGQEPHVTSDYEALLKLSRWCTQNKHEQGFAVCQKAIEIRALQTRQQMLWISADRDGRIRCGYNLVGSNTGRITCYESPTGSGYNLQTIPNYTNHKEAPGGVLGDRDLFLADEGCYFFQCDLSGADGWTVAAYAAMLGDETMLLDYKAGISPFKILTLMLRGLPVSKDRPELAHQVKVIGKDDWDRFACKRVQHGGSYLEGGLTISRNILKDSEGKLSMSPKECDGLKKFFFDRYWGVAKWHDWIARRLKERPILVAASGQVRQFFGRPDEVLTKAVAFEPQANTTYATNLAAWRLWSDADNRQPNSRDNEGTTINFQRKVVLRIEPLHQVHDALCGQFKITDTNWAAPKIKSYFNNELLIAGQKITIPYEGGYGKSWGSHEIGKL